MDLELEVPLSMSQIEAARKLYEMLPQWQQKNRILLALKEEYPNRLDPDGTLLKVVVLNQFYYTNVMAIDRMTAWILEIVDKEAQVSTEVEIVERIAALPMTSRQRGPRNHYSFASKFAHFFIDMKRFSIYDSSALNMIKIHLGWNGWENDQGNEYSIYFTNLNNLKRRSKLPFTYTFADLDRYLWLAGLYRDWKTKARPEINREVEELFNVMSPGGVPVPSLLDMIPSEFANLKRDHPHIWGKLFYNLVGILYIFQVVFRFY